MKSEINKNESGLAHIGIIIAAILVVAALAFGGWYVWDKNKEDDKKQSDNNSSQSNSPQSQNDEPSDPSEGGKYLVITEWGVRFELPEELRGDVEYGIFTEASSEQSTHFAIAEIDRLPDSNCGLEERTSYSGGSGVLGGVASIHRKSAQYPEEIAARYASETRLGDHWYYIESMRDACFTADGADFARLVGDIEGLAKAMKDLQQLQ